MSRRNPLTRKTCFTIVKQSLFYQKCVCNVQTMFVCVCRAKQLTPASFLPCISVKLKRHDFAKWVEILLRIICKSLKSLTSDDCWGNAIWHVFQTAVLDDVKRRPTTSRWALQLILNNVILCRHILCTLPKVLLYHFFHYLKQNENAGKFRKWTFHFVFNMTS